MLNAPAEQAAARIRGYLADNRFDKEGFKAADIHEEMPSYWLRNKARLEDLTNELTAPNLLFRLFRFGWSVEAAAAVRTLDPQFLRCALECGLLTEAGGAMQSPVMLTPFEDLLVATDHSRVIEAGSEPEGVLMVNSTTWLMYRFAIRRSPASTLEVCAGCGAIGMGAAAWSGRVVLSDLSRRATEFSRFAVALNRLNNVEVVNGDCFAPVAGRRFDQIIANPPFYVTPAYRMMCVNNDLGLDQFCRRLAGDAPRYLNEGGWFQMLCEWIEVKGQPWEERVREWFRDAGCDVWVVKGFTTTPDRYTQDRMRECYAPDPEADYQRYHEWMTYYREQKIEAIHRGFIVMRRRSGRNWMRVEETELAPTSPFGEGFVIGFDNLDFLAALSSDADLLNARFRLTPGIKMTHRFVPSANGFQSDGLRLSTTSGLPRLQKIDMTVAAFLNRMDGTLTLAQLVTQAASELGVPFEKVADEAAAMCRLLLERGFLQRAEAPGAAASA